MANTLPKKVTVTVEYEFEDGTTSQDVLEVKPDTIYHNLTRPVIQLPDGGLAKAREAFFVLHGMVIRSTE